jgi:hypothetical protein
MFYFYSNVFPEYREVMMRLKLKLIIRVILVGIVVSINSISYAFPVLVEGPITSLGQHLLGKAQGIKGYVVKLSGNHMPPARPPHAKTELIATKIWIFSGRINLSANPGYKLLIPNNQLRWPSTDARKHPQFLGWTTSDSQGYFQVGLSPGEYTLFAEYEDYLYLNGFNGDGSHGSIQVKEGQLREIRLINNENSMS